MVGLAGITTSSQSSDVICDVEIINGPETVRKEKHYTYLANTTPIIYSLSPLSGATRGGTLVQFVGEMLW